MKNSLDNQAAYWDAVAKGKTFTHPLFVERFDNRLDKAARVLDIGCGYGRTLNALYDLGYRNLLGLDISEKMVQRGRKAYPHLDLRGLTPDAWSTLKGSVDMVILFAVLTCIPTNSGQMALVDKIEAVLKPGGLLYVSDYWLQSDARNRLRYRAAADKYGVYGVFELPEGAVFRHHDRPWVESLFARFAVLESDDIEVTTMNGHSSLGFQYVGRKMKGTCDDR
ncbi:MAG: methyltransferase domain-containing protein [Deltaproteobacteria bacterium]|nr:methyltransferase domain-containing protein [Deltaproteobacteria bacterium]